ncbi:hypothetical protein GW17_00059740 [Ensete ventricosum]|nr:hypothetical protein GW17_00059740 [Ensete ventricosum]RZS28645.1 hypothetical protein BHM03_00062273 [Ensete ventricosum]
MARVLIRFSHGSKRVDVVSYKPLISWALLRGYISRVRRQVGVYICLVEAVGCLIEISDDSADISSHTNRWGSWRTTPTSHPVSYQLIGILEDRIDISSRTSRPRSQRMASTSRDVPTIRDLGERCRPTAVFGATPLMMHRSPSCVRPTTRPQTCEALAPFLRSTRVSPE